MKLLSSWESWLIVPGGLERFWTSKYCIKDYIEHLARLIMLSIHELRGCTGVNINPTSSVTAYYECKRYRRGKVSVGQVR